MSNPLHFEAKTEHFTETEQQSLTHSTRSKILAIEPRSSPETEQLQYETDEYKSGT